MAWMALAREYALLTTPHQHIGIGHAVDLKRLESILQPQFVEAGIGEGNIKIAFYDAGMPKADMRLQHIVQQIVACAAESARPLAIRPAQAIEQRFLQGVAVE
jgi:hypothetical protein